MKRRFGDFELDDIRKTLTRRGRKLRLTPQLFELLTMLIERPGEIVAREQIQQRLWPDTNVEYQHSVDVLVSQLRAALGDSATNSQRIQTVPKRGYRFLERVENQSEKNWVRLRRFALYAAVAILASILSVLIVHRRYDKFVPRSKDGKHFSAGPVDQKRSPEAQH